MSTCFLSQMNIERSQDDNREKSPDHAFLLLSILPKMSISEFISMYLGVRSSL